MKVLFYFHQNATENINIAVVCEWQ